MRDEEAEEEQSTFHCPVCQHSLTYYIEHDEKPDAATLDYGVYECLQCGRTFEALADEQGNPYPNFKKSWS